MDTSKSEFFHFGILPQVSIHSPIIDYYSKMYIPRETCECGSKEWIDSTMIMFEGYAPKDIHRCKKCNEIRVADHIGAKD